MFKEKRDGLCYVGSDGLEYELLEGMTSNGFTSDIIFIMDRNKNDNPGVIIDFVYGDIEDTKDFIQRQVEKYIENKEAI